MISVLWDYFKFLVRGLPTPPDKDFDMIKPGMLIFDIGANVGNYSALFLKRGARVIAVEPQPFCYRFLRLRFMFTRNVQVVAAGAGDSEGVMQMNVSSAHTLSSLNPEWVKKVNDSKRFAQSQPKWNQKVDVLITTLDHLITKYGEPDYIKIDVEGFEKNVLSGLNFPAKCISFEFTLPELKEDAEACVDRLLSLGNYRFASLLDSNTTDTISGSELKNQINAICTLQSLANGDIFAYLSNE